MTKKTVRGNISNIAMATSIAMLFLTACGDSFIERHVDRDRDRNQQPEHPPMLAVNKLDGRYFHAIKAKEELQVPLVNLKKDLHPTSIDLPALEIQKNALNKEGKGIATQMAQAREIEQLSTVAKMKKALNWQYHRSDGSYQAAIQVNSKGAFGIRLGIRVHTLPDQAMLYFYGNKQTHSASGAEIKKIIRDNLDSGDHSENAKTWWAPDVGEESVTMHIVLPAGISPDTVSLAIPRLSHTFSDLGHPNIRQGIEKSLRKSVSCHKDSNCYTNGKAQRDAVARLKFVRDGNGYWCTGTLLNDAIGSGIPYLLTANHCISNQTTASTLETEWFYRSAECDSDRTDKRATTRQGGAKLLYTSHKANKGTDVSLMALHADLPDGVYLAGWDANTIDNLSQFPRQVFGMHHPEGEMLKISGGVVKGVAKCDSLYCRPNEKGSFYMVYWGEGVTETGSSGSAIFNDSNHIIGTLQGGYASCRNPGGEDYYGRFDLAFQSGLNQFLAAAQKPEI